MTPEANGRIRPVAFNVPIPWHETDIDRSPPQPEVIRELREHDWSIFKIAAHLKVSLSEVRRALDEKARADHERWAS